MTELLISLRKQKQWEENLPVSRYHSYPPPCICAHSAFLALLWRKCLSAFLSGWTSLLHIASHLLLPKDIHWSSNSPSSEFFTHYWITTSSNINIHIYIYTPGLEKKILTLHLPVALAPLSSFILPILKNCLYTWCPISLLLCSLE